MEKIPVTALQTWLRSGGAKRRRAFCEKLNIHPVYLSQVLSGHRKASPKLARQMQIVSGGAVRAAEIRPDIFDDIVA